MKHLAYLLGLEGAKGTPRALLGAPTEGILNKSDFIAEGTNLLEAGGRSNVRV